MSIRSIVKRSKLFCTAYYLAQNWWSRQRLSFRLVKANHGNTHANLNIEESLGYINKVFNDYLEYGNISKDLIQGKRILEVGPGDNLGVTLLFAAYGAEQILSIDRFYSRRNRAHERNIYLALRKNLHGKELQNFDGAVDLSSKGPIFNKERVQYIYGVGLEEAPKVLAQHLFDVILSRAVLEHLYDIPNAFISMDKLLLPGGLMIHKVDLRDHGMFSRGGMHPLTFLTFTDRFYYRLSSHTGRPNRHRMKFYKDKMDELGYRSTIRITKTIGADTELTNYPENLTESVDYTPEETTLVEGIRPKLDAQFRDLPIEDLLAAGIFISAKKTSNN